MNRTHFLLRNSAGLWTLPLIDCFTFYASAVDFFLSAPTMNPSQFLRMTGKRVQREYTKNLDMGIIDIILGTQQFREFWKKWIKNLAMNFCKILGTSIVNLFRWTMLFKKS